jgi:hypothetical protein
MIPEELLIHAPWGQEYRSEVSLTASATHPSSGASKSYYWSNHSAPENREVFKGVFAAKVDWNAIGFGPGALPDATKLDSGWAVRSADGGVNARLELSSVEVQGLIAMISQAIASHSDDAVGHDGEHAELDVTLSNESDAKGVNRLFVTATNRGPDPAYRVVARLKSSSTVIHGIQLSFGRVDRDAPKKLPKRLPTLSATDELDPMVSVEVTAWNAPSATTKSRLHLTASRVPPPAPLQLSCAAVEKDAAPGQQLRIQCESTNPNESATHVKAVDVAVGTGAALPATGLLLPELEPHGRFKFQLTAALPRSAKAGSSMPILITINASDFAPVQQQILIQVTHAGMCTQGKLTRDAYEAKRKRMQDALKSGSLNQAEYDRYDAENVSCLE